jgi:hypothetical protein
MSIKTIVLASIAALSLLAQQRVVLPPVRVVLLEPALLVWPSVVQP